MHKHLVIPAIALAAILMLFTPVAASAHPHWGVSVGIGGPAWGYYPYGYYGPWAYPYYNGYGPYYYGYYGVPFTTYGYWHGHDNWYEHGWHGGHGGGHHHH